MALHYKVRRFGPSFQDQANILEKIEAFLNAPCLLNVSPCSGASCLNGTNNTDHDEKKETILIYLFDADNIVSAETDDLDLLARFLAGEWSPSISDAEISAHPGFFLFLSHSKSLTAWEDSSNQKHHNLKRNQFYIRSFISYQIGQFISYEPSDLELGNCPATRGSSRFVTELKRLVARQRASKQNLKTILSDIKRDVEALQDLAVEEIGGQPKRGSSFMETVSSPEHFLTALAALYQLGRRPQPEAEKIVEQNSSLKWLKGYGGSYKLTREINTELERLRRSQWNARYFGRQITQLQAKLRNYQILRDFAQWMATAASHWAKQEQGIKVLFIDETLVDESIYNLDLPASQQDHKNELEIRRALRETLTEKLKNIHATLGGEIEFDYVLPRNTGIHNQTSVWESIKHSTDTDGYIAVDRFLPKDPPSQFQGKRQLVSYDIILVEVEFRGQYIGPRIVQRLAAYFDQHNATSPVRDRASAETKPEPDDSDPQQDNEQKHLPSVIVLSQAENFAHIQQCLNLGAQAYVTKQRIYGIPARVAKARIRHTTAEPRGRKSNFRSLYQLLPRQIAKLQSDAQGDLIHGYPWDDLERHWLKALPKADLHHHIGTCITLATIEALAFNTSGYLFHNKAGQGSQPIPYQLLENLQEIVEQICQVVILAGVINKVVKPCDLYPPAKILLIAAAAVLSSTDGKSPSAQRTKNLPETDVYGELVKWLTRPHRQIDPFEVSSLLVTAICLTAGTSNDVQAQNKAVVDRVTQQWAYLSNVQAWAEVALPPYKEIIREVFKLCQGITGSSSWHRGLTLNQSWSNFHAKGASWQQCLTKVEERVKATVEKLDALFLKALQALTGSSLRLEDSILKSYQSEIEQNIRYLQRDLRDATQWKPSSDLFILPPLKQLIVIPENANPNDQTLLRYLWGAGLLGAEHLQYPENIVLAARDIVEQAVDENIVYSEIRCATTGYAVGGMNTIDATDLLCISFDLAAAYFAAHPTQSGQKRWVRINVLLGAKRHKPEEQFQDIVALLTYYLQKGNHSNPELEKIVPGWWQRSRVVGFDLSGNEAAEMQRPEDLMKPLFKYCAPITIHAGEAATAESIWQAVYRFGARRIGHGLRLRENRRLLDYCITEGLCLEMCPISNQFTNGFMNVDSHNGYRGSWRQHYPLRYYLDQGLDVCINTDNRQLHTNNTLTDEYMCAAHMVGGLTKWEVLKLVKAGFKHAFLLKKDIEILLQAVEDEVYRLITDAGGMSQVSSQADLSK